MRVYYLSVLQTFYKNTFPTIVKIFVWRCEIELRNNNLFVDCL